MFRVWSPRPSIAVSPLADFTPSPNTRQLATGKYGCRKARVCPAECGQQLGRDPSKHGSSKSLVLKSFSGEGPFWDLSLPVTLTLWDTPVVAVCFRNALNSRISRRQTCRKPSVDTAWTLFPPSVQSVFEINNYSLVEFF